MPSRPDVIRVVGVTFAPNYPTSLLRLNDAMNETASPAGPSALLVRAPDNPHNSNAIEVHVPALGHYVGHVARDLAKAWAPRLDAGEHYQASVTGVWTAREHPRRPGVEVTVTWGRP